MIPFTEHDIRSSFINASQRERGAIPLPAGFAEIDWDARDYLGWRDPKQPQLGYLLGRVDEAAVGILLKQTEARTRTRPQCSWCEDVRLPNDVALFTAKVAGAAGRKGDTVGAYLCSEFQCSANVRKLTTMAYIGFDVEAERERRIGVLREHVDAFLRRVQNGA